MSDKVQKLLCLILLAAFVTVGLLGYRKDRQDRAKLLAAKTAYEQKEEKEKEAEEQKAEEQKEAEAAEEEKEADPFTELRVITLGDGISKDGIYQNKLKTALNLKEVVNKANNGVQMNTMISEVSGDELKNTDLVLVHAGINDYTKSTYIGYASDDKSVDSYCGSIKNLIASIKSANGDAKIIFMTPQKHGDVEGQASYPNPNYQGNYLDDYVNAIKSVCSNEGVTVIDLFSESGIESSNITQYTSDNLHLNDAGAQKVADCIAKSLKAVYTKAE